MIHVLGITPDVFELVGPNAEAGFVHNAERELDHLWSLFYENALLANMGGGYWIETFQKLKTSQSLKDKIYRHLQKLHDLNRIIDYLPSDPKRPTSNHEWLTLGYNDAKTYKIDKVITTERLRIKAGLLNDHFLEFPLNPFDGDLLEIQSDRTYNVTRKTLDLKKVLTSILRYAKRVIIIDPYMTCSNIRVKKKKVAYQNIYQQPYLNLLNMVGALLGDGNRMEIFTSEKSSLPISKLDFNNAVNLPLQSIASLHHITVRFCMLGSATQDNQHEQKTMLHDRYLLTDQFGISMSNSLFADKPGDEANMVWQILSEKAWKAKFEECTTSPFYPTLNDIVIKP